jgi:2-polyprenyl-3-methyl-5-hydroxy-6-metoxy-1,4-benzoquinol methylase
MAVRSKINAAAPKKWMDAWDKIYSQMLAKPDEELSKIEIGHRIRLLEHAFAVTETETNGLKILELGCGDGNVACYLARLGCHVVAVDALASAIAVAQRKARILELMNRIEFRLDDIDGWPIEPESYDVVIALQSLQYLFDRAIPRLREAIAAVKPGGFLVYSGNTLPHYNTDPSIRFVAEDELKMELDGWTLHAFGIEERIINPNDLRGYVWTVARKPFAL